MIATDDQLRLKAALEAQANGPLLSPLRKYQWCQIGECGNVLSPGYVLPDMGNPISIQPADPERPQK